MKLIWSIYSVTELIVLLGMINNDYFVYKRHILEYNYHVCSDDPNTLIVCFTIHIYTDSEFDLIFPPKHFPGA